MSQGRMNTKNIAATIAKQLNLALVWRSKSEKFIDAFNFAGAKSKLLEKLNKLDNFIAYIDNNSLMVVDKDEQPPEEETSTTKKAGYLKLITGDSGLIGLPQPDEYGVKIKVLLDPAVALGDWFKLESKRLPIVNGFYQVYEMTYDFATREPQYYLEIFGKNRRV